MSLATPLPPSIGTLPHLQLWNMSTLPLFPYYLTQPCTYVEPRCRSRCLHTDHPICCMCFQLPPVYMLRAYYPSLNPRSMAAV